MKIGKQPIDDLKTIPGVNQEVAPTTSWSHLPIVRCELQGSYRSGTYCHHPVAVLLGAVNGLRCFLGNLKEFLLQPVLANIRYPNRLKGAKTHMQRQSSKDYTFLFQTVEKFFREM